MMKQKVILVIAVLAIGIGVGWYFWPQPRAEWGPFELLRSEDARKELKLTEDQVSKIKILLDSSWKSYQQLGSAKENAPQKKKVRFDTFDALEKTLTPEQLHRMVELQRQQLGPATFYDPRTARVLELTAQQKDKINDILEKFSLKRLELYDKKAFKKLAELDKEILSEIMNVLDGEQKRGLNKMLGEPFKGKLPPPNYFPSPKKVREE